jgi:hypothetical protein
MPGERLRRLTPIPGYDRRTIDPGGTVSSPAFVSASRRALGLSAIALALALSGCSSSETPPADPDSSTSPGGTSPEGALPDPCSLLTAPQIEAVSEYSFAEGEFNPQLSTSWQSICEWYATDATVTFVQIVITADASTVALQRETAEDMMGGSVDVTVPGAENAYTVAGGSILGMGVKDYFVQVSYMTTSIEDVTSITTALAAEVAAAL